MAHVVACLAILCVRVDVYKRVSSSYELHTQWLEFAQWPSQSMWSVCVCNAKYWSIVTLLLYAQCTRYTMLFRVGLPTRPTKMPTSYFNVRFWTRSITQRVISTQHSGQNSHSCSGMQSGVWRAMAGLVVLMLVVGLPLSVLRLLCNTTHSFRANAPLGTNKRWSQYIAPPSTRSM